MLSSDQDLTARAHRLPQHGGAHLRCSEECSTVREWRRGCRARRRRAESAAVRLLHRFPAAACSQVVELGGALRVQYLAGLASVDEPERAGLNERVWEVAGSEVSVSV
jgi:hypothetical protein